MPLAGTGPALGDAIKAAIDGVGDKTDRNAVFEAMGTAIVAHIIANGLVVTTTPGITPGPSAAPGTGMIT